MSSKISDGHASYDMSSETHSTLKAPTSKHQEDEDASIFDSGILSEGYICSATLSEEDIKCVSSTEENEKKAIGQKETERDNTATLKRSSEIESPMRLDSGIDIDLSDQFYSRSDSYNLEKSFEEEVAHKKEESKAKSASVNALSWEEFFQQDDDGNTLVYNLTFVLGFLHIRWCSAHFVDSTFLGSVFRESGIL